ncbi:MAG: beta-galactosidase trimerization domain-containing protein [Sedimentisphaerales bacterium]|nr:beta-galactosidase trimerization domain-containing protein [Sedimentisphaerales bacterium]
MTVFRRLWIMFLLGGVCAGASEADTSRPAYVAPKPLWDTFTVFVWQYRTSIERDRTLYDAAGFRGYHIDRGAGKAAAARYGEDNGFVYYVDHVADKGLLHLTEQTGRDTILRKRQVVERPNSLAEAGTVQMLREHIRRNIADVKTGPAAAYALDDEPSVGVFTSPCEVDGSAASVAGYREWLRRKYGHIERLNAVWQTRLRDFDQAQPVSFEEVRRDHRRWPFREWNLSRWMDWRSYMDSQFADCLAGLVCCANEVDPTTPAGIVGGQQPAPYGGYNYAKLCTSMQWIEAYDIGGTCEILRSLWAWPERRPYMQTWFSTGDARQDRWFLWYYLLHGNRGVIAWPEDENGPWFQYNGHGLAPYVAANAATVREVQGEVSRFILDTDTRFDPDPVAVVYSHGAVQAGWVMDASVHGGTWPNRSSSMDNANQTAGINRVAWFKLLEDCGYQYTVVTDEQVAEGILLRDKYRVLILPRLITLSSEQAGAIEAFAKAGGTVIADYLTGVLDENGLGQANARLDDVFGVTRDESKGYFDGETIAEIDAERYREPFVERLRYEAALTWNDLVVAERGLTAEPSKADAAERIDGADVLVKRSLGEGRAVYLNLTPVAYYDSDRRRGRLGDQWRRVMGDLLAESGLRPRARVVGTTGEYEHKAVPLTEVVFWRRGDEVVIGVVKNPVRKASISGAGPIDEVWGEPMEIELLLSEPVTHIRNIRTGQTLPDGDRVAASWDPSEALLIQVVWPEDR